MEMNLTENVAENQYLSCHLNKEMYGIPINKVREVLEFSSVTKVPRTPDYMRGVINLRGNVVPVVDLKMKFNMGATEKTVNTCVIILEIALEEEQTLIGALTDSVQEVVEIDVKDIEPAPKIGTSLKTEFIAGMGKKDEEFIILLDTNKVFSYQELEALESLDKRDKKTL